MARGGNVRTRYLKPGFFENEQLAELPATVRLLFAGLWLMADRDGRLRDRPARIKGELFSYESVNIEKGLKLLEAAGFIARYEYTDAEDSQKLIWIPSFLKHQHPHPNEAPSTLGRHPYDQGYDPEEHLGYDVTRTNVTSDANLGNEPRPPMQRVTPTNATAQSVSDSEGDSEGNSDSNSNSNGNSKGNSDGSGPKVGPPSPLACGSIPSDQWDFTLHLYAQNIGVLDDQAHKRLRELFIQAPSEWTAAAINQSSTTETPGFGYVVRILEDCIAKNEAPSTLRSKGRGRKKA